MLDILKAKNPKIPIFSVESEEFRAFGRMLDGFDTAEVIEAAAAIKKPESGSSYLPSADVLENLDVAAKIENECFGTLPTQIGYCWGHNNFLNGGEWHFSSEINIAVTPLVLLLAHTYDVFEGKIDSSSFKAFYLPEGTVAEIYATSVHFCPCEVSPDGFGCVVALPEGTNTPLASETSAAGTLFRRNKWLLAHVDNKGLIDRGAVPGITGENIEIKY